MTSRHVIAVLTLRTAPTARELRPTQVAAIRESIGKTGPLPDRPLWGIRGLQNRALVYIVDGQHRTQAAKAGPLPDAYESTHMYALTHKGIHIPDIQDHLSLR